MNLAFLVPGGAEIWIILIVVLLLFGNRIPGMARSLGSGIVEFKKGLRGDDDAERLPPPSRSDSETRAEVVREPDRQKANT